MAGEGEQAEGQNLGVTEEEKPKSLPAYVVAARAAVQGAYCGVGATPPVLLVSMWINALEEGASSGGFLQWLGLALVYMLVFSTWGAMLTLIEEFARRAKRPWRRAIAASVVSPVFAVLVVVWIVGVGSGGPLEGVEYVLGFAGEFERQFSRAPLSTSLLGAGIAVPVWGLLLMRQGSEARGRAWSVEGYYGSCVLIGVTAGLTMIAAVLAKPGPSLAPGDHVLLVAIIAICVGLVLGMGWGLSRGRRRVDPWLQRYAAWAQPVSEDEGGGARALKAEAPPPPPLGDSSSGS